MGRIYRAPRSAWWIADYVDFEGKRRRVKASRDQREARKLLAALEGQVVQNRLLGVRPTKPAHFEEFAARFLEHVRSELRCWTRYETSLRSLTPFFGKVALTGITPELIERFKRARIEEVEPATANRDVCLLRRMFNLAIAWGYARENPVRLVKLFKERNSRLRYLTREEYERLLAACPEWLRALVTVAAHTGMRKGELLRLTWTDVDLENGFASVNDAKNATPRKVPLNETARGVLSRLKEGSTSIPVFTRANGGRLSKEYVRKPFERALVAAKIEDFRFHDLRHTCGSWLSMAGVDIRRIQEVLGHKTIAMTLRYSHLSPKQAADAVARLDEFLSLPRSAGRSSADGTARAR